MKYSFHPSAKNEFNEAIDYYDDCQAGLGKEFAKKFFLLSNVSSSFLKRGQDYQKIQEDV